MALSALQRNVLRCIAANRSDTSYIAGGVALNRDWPRVSDDIDVFHDTDEEIGAAASADIETLRQAGFSVRIELEIYGIVEAVVSQGAQSTIVQWMSESRTRFFPLVKDDAWGARLHQTDLAVNKVIAASSRTKARDFVDLVAISENMCPLGPLLLAAAGKPPHFSPSRMIEEIRRRGLSVPTAEYEAVKGLPPGLDAAAVREKLIAALDQGESYVMTAPVELVGVLACDAYGTPVEARSTEAGTVLFRRATPEPEAIPSLPDAPQTWTSGR